MRIVTALLLVAMLPLKGLSAQWQATWQERLGVVAGPDHPPPDSLFVCFQEVQHPDSIVLRSAGRLRAPVGYFWTTDSSMGFWDRLFAPDEDDSLPARVLGYACPDGPTTEPAVLIEHAGAIGRLFAPSFADAARVIASNGSDTLSIAATISHPSKSLAHLHLPCGDSLCYSGLVSIAPLLDSVRRMRSRQASAAVAAAQARRDRVARERAAEEASWRAHGWPEADIVLIRNGKIRIGMTPPMVRAAWGSPTRINATTTTSGTEEQWVYASEYVYFDASGRVRAIQTSR